MVLENIGLGFAWNWIHGYEAFSPKPNLKSSKKKMRRSEFNKPLENECNLSFFLVYLRAGFFKNTFCSFR